MGLVLVVNSDGVELAPVGDGPLVEANPCSESIPPPKCLLNCLQGRSHLPSLIPGGFSSGRALEMEVPHDSTEPISCHESAKSPTRYCSILFNPPVLIKPIAVATQGTCYQ
ncbi:unnamed protein product [Phytophthora fragariaefolia]|uniref:Unnamed protein product n=1 Tax=Phytophthora fragariaefolia TaxID=1490495 RepID=A0A9W6XJM3_9STRA|nr:unnamed protein product [Phytophthora fragariaefolia]